MWTRFKLQPAVTKEKPKKDARLPDRLFCAENPRVSSSTLFLGTLPRSKGRGFFYWLAVEAWPVVFHEEFRRVGAPGYPGDPLTEPDLWASHPALQVDFSMPGRRAWPEAVAFGLARFQADLRLCNRLWNHWFRYAVVSPGRLLFFQALQRRHAARAAVFGLTPRSTRCRNRKRGRFRCTTIIARSRRRICAS